VKLEHCTPSVSVLINAKKWMDMEEVVPIARMFHVDLNGTEVVADVSVG
jgi:hypothetical protein